MSNWTEVAELPDALVSDQGEVMNAYSNRILRPRQNRQDILMVGIQHEGTQYTRSVALLVAKAFVHNPIPRLFDSIIYLNGDRTDCRAINLMWRTRPFALRYHDMFNDEPFRVSVKRSDNGEYYYSLRELCTRYGLIEKAAYNHLFNREPCYPYGWTIERT